jgi:adenosine deaminase
MLLKKLMTMRKYESINVDQYFEGVKEILDYLEEINFSIPTKLVVLLIFDSLPSQYNLFLKIMTTKDSLCT